MECKMILELIIKYLIIILLIFCHEMGHILMCVIFFNCKEWKVELGFGKVLFETRRFIVKSLIICGKILPNIDPEYYMNKSKLEKTMIPLGGPLFNILVLLLALPIALNNGAAIEGYSELFINCFKFFYKCNAGMLFWTLLPIYYKKGEPSDGRRILNIIRNQYN